MSSKVFVTALTLCTALSACKEEASANAQAETPSGDYMEVLISENETLGNASKPSTGYGCSVKISFKNHSDKKVSLVQFMSYTVVSPAGTLTDNGSNFRLDPGEATDRAGLYFSGTSCEDIQSVTFDQVFCWYKGGMSSDDPELQCVDKLSIVNKTDINFVLAPQS